MNRTSLLSAFGVASTLVGAVIGAGFASGQEVVSFFHPLGRSAPAGLTVAALVLAAGGVLVVKSASTLKARDYGALIRLTAGPRFGSVLDALVSAFLFLTLSVTVAGGAAILHGSYGVPPLSALALTCLGGGLMVSRGPAAVFRASSLLVPVLIVALLLVLSRPVAATGPPAGPSPSQVPRGVHGDPGAGGSARPVDAVASGCLYGAYNLILGVGILVAGARYRGPGPAIAGAGAGGLALGALASRILTACRAAGPEVLEAQVPMAALAAGAAGWEAYLYALALGLAVLTTTGCIALSLAERCGVSAKGFRGPGVIILAAAPLASWGFARLVRTVYPALGLVGICWLAVLAIGAWGKD